MVFSSPLCLLGFLPITLFLYFFVNDRFKNVVLLLSSLFFYAWGEPRNIILMLLTIVVNYLCGLGIEKLDKSRKFFLISAIIFDMGCLFIYKYLNFSVDAVCSLLGKSVNIAEIVLPIGISFYTFQIMSYVIDVYRGDVAAQHNILDLGLYISLFPQLIAGPIVRYIDVAREIRSRKSTWDGVYAGVMRFCVGFSKKVLIADQLASLVDSAFLNAPSLPLKWVGIVAYSLQIYFDFSGYSDMAIGLGSFFGFHFEENFNFPYISRSVKEFWRRWHISLSTWFRDYLYIPLGGSRKGKARTYLNLMIVFLATGLWHGASYNFVVWGLFYAVFLILERLFLGRVLERLPVVIQHAYTLLVIIIGWVFFRAQDLPAALEYIKGMFVPTGRDIEYLIYYMNPQYWVCIVAGIFFSFPHKKAKEFIRGTKVGSSLADAVVLITFAIAVCYMVGSGFSPFLYFRF